MRTPIMAIQPRPKVVAGCQDAGDGIENPTSDLTRAARAAFPPSSISPDFWEMGPQVLDRVPDSRNGSLGYVLINAQIAAGYALTLLLRHQWYLVTSTSVYGLCA
jgi:hypothetical protein